MRKSPRLRGREIIKALQKADFTIQRIRGSHYFLQHDDGRCTVVPVHSAEIIGPGLFSKILRDCELSISEFQDLL
ncbi:MAG: type II toxin-antitoxin system HicA family toxin [Ignavibacteriae bacterium]|nr:type II toxin-antitoxin system HicA family toxin [Ignavibacteriota bacterium]